MPGMHMVKSNKLSLENDWPYYGGGVA